jgi:hypothetical protein
LPENTQASDVPVFIETQARQSFPLVRCIYMAIENNDPLAGWGITLNGRQMPFLMLGLSGIIQQPFGTPQFNSYGVIEDFFARIEKSPGLMLVFQDVWLPPFLFSSEVELGTIYRIREDLFRIAYRFRDGGMTKDEFGRSCSELKDALTESKEETFAFGGWIAEQVGMAREPKNPGLGLRLKHDTEA